MASTSTTERYPIKAKSLTLMELCQSIHDFRNPTTRNTAQILTRRLYLHPLTVSGALKMHSTKISTNQNQHQQHHQYQLHHLHHHYHHHHNQQQHPSSQNNSNHQNENGRSSSLEKKAISGANRISKDFTIHSSSVPLVSRSMGKLNNSTVTEVESTNDLEASVATMSTNPTILPNVHSRKTTPTIKRAASLRTSHTFYQRKVRPIRQRPEKVDVWGQLAHTLERPVPIDPPTTPFTQLNDFHFESVVFDDKQESPRYYSRQEFQEAKRINRRSSMIAESHAFSNK